MDLMDFDQAGLYFDEPVPETVQALIAEAGGTYGDPSAEALLHKAYFIAPEALVVLVALYRYYFYKHRLEDALIVADRTLRIVGARLGFPAEWTRLHPEFLGQAVLRSMGLLRFYLSVLKATGTAVFKLSKPIKTRFLLIYLTSLPPESGSYYQGGIGTIEVRG